MLVNGIPNGGKGDVKFCELDCCFDGGVVTALLDMSIAVIAG